MSKRINARSLLQTKLRQRPRHFRLANSGRAQNRNDPTGRSGFLSPARERRIARANAEIAGRCEMTVCAVRFQSKQLLGLFFFQGIDRNAGPTGDNVLDVVARHFRRDKRIFLRRAQTGAVVRARPVVQVVQSARLPVPPDTQLHARRLRRSRRSPCQEGNDPECSGAIDKPRPPTRRRYNERAKTLVTLTHSVENAHCFATAAELSLPGSVAQQPTIFLDRLTKLRGRGSADALNLAARQRL